MAVYRDRTSFTVPAFTVPAGANTYAPEILRLHSTVARSEPIYCVTMLVQSLPAGAVAELWLPQANATAHPVPDAEFYPSSYTLNGAGGASFPLADWPGAQIRVRSGGTAGTAVISANGD